MLKTLSERIAKAVALKKLPNNSKNRVAFLAMRTEIKQALDDGWSVKVIWETFVDEGTITFSYQTFRRYVRRLKPSSATADVDPSHPNKRSGKVSGKAVTEKKPPALAQFTFEATPNKEALF